MRTLIALGLVLVAAAASAQMPDLPADKKVEMKRNDVGDPVVFDPTKWSQVQSFPYEECAGLLITDGERMGAVLYRTPVVAESPAVFYLIQNADGSTAEWAGDMSKCEAKAESPKA